MPLWAEDSTMRQLLRVLVGISRRDGCRGTTPCERVALMLRSAIACVSMALLMVGCAGHSLVPKEQGAAIKARDRALSLHAEAIHQTIRQSATLGALAFLDATDGHLVVMPGDTPADAWARYTALQPPNSAGVPPVLSFVYRADVPKAPETVTSPVLREQHGERQAAEALAALEAELRDEERRTEERIGALTRAQRELSDALAEETRKSIAAARDEMQAALKAVAEDVAAARQFMLQTAKLGWLNHELTVENANELRKVATASQELTANAARLADTMRQLSGALASQLKELADRLDSLQNRIGNIK